MPHGAVRARAAKEPCRMLQQNPPSRRSTRPGAERSSLTMVHHRISDLRPDPRNPRRHDQAQVRQIARSIESFGFNVPVLIDADRNVIAGHGRLLACKLLGWDEVPTLRLDHLTAAQKRAFMIADN